VAIESQEWRLRSMWNKISRTSQTNLSWKESLISIQRRKKNLIYKSVLTV
jgi:hypothetical protein